jgi:hypothetical protein
MKYNSDLYNLRVIRFIFPFFFLPTAAAGQPIKNKLEEEESSLLLGESFRFFFPVQQPFVIAVPGSRLQ